MNSLHAIEQEYQNKLSELYPSSEIKQLFLLCYAHISGKKALHYALERRDELTEADSVRYLALLEELAIGRPLQHILGEAPFFGLMFHVNAHTLIPRPETEELVQLILDEHGNHPQLEVLDVGTGSGCIAISLAKKLKEAMVHAIDISKPALEVAKTNAKKHAVAVNFINADISEWSYFMQDDQLFDIIVSNPPYITPKEQDAMHSNVMLYEPHSALFVEEHAPMFFYDVIADLARKHLKPDGTLYFEINQYLAEETADLLRKKGYQKVDLFDDLNAAKRMIRASY